MTDQSQFGQFLPGVRDLQATALDRTIDTPLVRKVSHFSAVVFGGSARLPPCPPMQTYRLTVINRGPNILIVWPPEFGRIENNSKNMPVGFSDDTIDFFAFGKATGDQRHWYVSRPSILQLPVNLFEQTDQALYVTDDLGVPINVLM